MLKQYIPNRDEFAILGKVCGIVRADGVSEPSERPLMVKFWTHFVRGGTFHLEWYFYGPNRELPKEPRVTFESIKGGHISRFCLRHGDWTYDWQLKDQFFDEKNEPIVPGLRSGSTGLIRYMNKSTFDRDILFLKMVLSDDGK